MSIDQPDFQNTCCSYFTGKPRPVRYRLRYGTPHLRHDVIFMSGLLHDATFHTTDATRGKHNLTININRDCAETEDCRSCRSRLSFSGFTKVQWVFADTVPNPDDKLVVLSLWMTVSLLDEVMDTLQLNGHGWCLLLSEADRPIKVILQDLTKSQQRRN